MWLAQDAYTIEVAGSSPALTTTNPGLSKISSYIHVNQNEIK